MFYQELSASIIRKKVVNDSNKLHALSNVSRFESSCLKVVSCFDVKKMLINLSSLADHLKKAYG